MKEIACFISPHGFGHATRVIAVIEALQKHLPDLHPHIFTTVPEYLFAETLSSYSYHPVQVDIGLQQKRSNEVDLERTVKKLADFLPFSPNQIRHLASLCSTCAFILCDIAPLGIVVGRALGVPSVLLENFTWDWIYKSHRGLAGYASQLQQEFNEATYRIQTDPVCQATTHDLSCGPIFRRCRLDRTTLRQRLGAASRKIIVITTGGIGLDLPIWDGMSEMPGVLFLLLGQQKSCKRGENIILLEKNTQFYHPDLINCADLVVCKAGYSTIAECFQAGARVIAVANDNFPESDIISNYLQEKMSGSVIDQNTFLSGRWLAGIDEVLTQPHPPVAQENGADRVATFLKHLLDKSEQESDPRLKNPNHYLSSSTAHQLGNQLLGLKYLLRDLHERSEVSEEDRKLLLLGLEECQGVLNILRKIK